MDRLTQGAIGVRRRGVAHAFDQGKVDGEATFSKRFDALEGWTGGHDRIIESVDHADGKGALAGGFGDELGREIGGESDGGLKALGAEDGGREGDHSALREADGNGPAGRAKTLRSFVEEAGEMMGRPLERSLHLLAAIFADAIRIPSKAALERVGPAWKENARGDGWMLSAGGREPRPIGEAVKMHHDGEARMRIDAGRDDLDELEFA